MSKCRTKYSQFDEIKSEVTIKYNSTVKSDETALMACYVFINTFIVSSFQKKKSLLGTLSQQKLYIFLYPGARLR